MASSSEVVHGYGQLASVMARMVALARAGEWGQLPELEVACSEQVRRLQAGAPVAALEPAQQVQARQLAERIHADQDEVCRLVKPQLEQLVRDMAQLQKARELEKAYGLAA